MHLSFILATVASLHHQAMGLKNYLIATSLCVSSAFAVYAQDQKVADSLRAIYEGVAHPDSSYFEMLVDVCFNETRDLEQAVGDADAIIALAQHWHQPRYERAGYFLKGTKLRLQGKPADALEAFSRTAQLARKQHNLNAEGDAYSEMAATYSAANDHVNAVYYYQLAINTLRKINARESLASVLNNYGDEFLRSGQYDSALFYCLQAKQLYDSLHYTAGIAYSTGNIGMAYAGVGRKDLAEKNINDAIRTLEKNEDYYPICVYLNSMSKIYLDKGDDELALSYANRSLTLAETYKLNPQIRDASLRLSELFEKMGNMHEAFAHYKKYITYRDTVNNISTVAAMYSLRTSFERAKQKAQLAERDRREKLYSILLFSALFIALVIGVLLVILFRNNRQKQKAFNLLSQQKMIIEEQRDTTNQALHDLKEAQAHLVHSEKMASLGQLSAGVAHEIQNPLNFVNNFSELNTELLAEMEQHMERGNVEDMKSLFREINSNEQKIRLHGRRAEGIITGMLSHSRSGPIERRLTDVNSLADEYFRLAYHGVRAKDKSLNVIMNTHFDESIGNINIAPQEIGRVILNLANNAFYAVSEKRKNGDEKYKPTVELQTTKDGANVVITLSDNGIGIPPAIRQKIFQPFFTTKGPGVGTGLGLSLSYDIIKGHGGELTVESEEGEGSTFKIILPLGER